MEDKTHSTQEIIRFLRQGDGGNTAKSVCREHNISQQTFYRWKKKYGGMDVGEARRLKQLEDENRRLKRIVADQALNLQVLKDLLGNKL